VLGYNYPGSQWYSDSYEQLVFDGVARPGSRPPSGQAEQPGFFSRAWHAVF
jgi:outer membrane protein assembly factor BamD